MAAPGQDEPLEPMLTIGCQDLIRQGCTHCGMLRKRNMLSAKSHSLKFFGKFARKYIPWFQSYVVVKDGCMYWYSDEKATKPQKAKSLYGYNKVVRALEIEETEAVWCFKLIHWTSGKKPYFFSAYSEHELKTWMVKIKQEMCKANNKLEEAQELDTDQEGIARISFTYIEGSIYDDVDSPKLKEGLYDDDDDSDDGDEYVEIDEKTMMPPTPPRPNRSLPVPPSLKSCAKEKKPPSPLSISNSSNHESPVPEQPTKNHLAGVSSAPGSSKHLTLSRRPPPPTPGSTTEPEQPPAPKPKPRKTSMEDTKRNMGPVVSSLHEVFNKKNEEPTPARPPRKSSSGSQGPRSPTSPTTPKTPITPKGIPLFNRKSSGELPKQDVPRLSGRLEKALWHNEAKFYDVVLFNSTDREAANRIVQQIGIDGVYLIRPGNEGGQKVLVVLVEGAPKKYKINYESEGGRWSYNIKAGVEFACIQDLLEYYYDHDLPTAATKLQLPFSRAK